MPADAIAGRDAVAVLAPDPKGFHDSAHVVAIPDGPTLHPEPPYLTVPELAAILRVPVSCVYSWTSRVGPNAIPRYRLGKRLGFRLDEVLKWVEEHQRVGIVPRHRVRESRSRRCHREPR